MVINYTFKNMAFLGVDFSGESSKQRITKLTCEGENLKKESLESSVCDSVKFQTPSHNSITKFLFSFFLFP